MTTPTNKIQIPDRLYFRIGDVADLIGVKPYVLRYWESEFPMINPQKSPSGQRVYRKSDVETVVMIKHLLYEERYSIEGARKRIKELRKEGELKGFKEGAVAGTLSSEAEEQPQPSPETVEKTDVSKSEIRALAEELRSLVDTPLSHFFPY
jgi:DNA-binding transcriptional MerR regulator